MKRIIILSLMLMLIVRQANAQPYEIRTVNKGGGIIGVEMKVTGGTAPSTSAFMTDLVFGLKWLSSYNVDLSNTVTTAYNIKKSDVRKQKNSFSYQAFYADQTPFNFPAAWALNNWVEIMSIANSKTGQGIGEFVIAENGFDVTTNPNIGINLTDYTPLIVGSALGVVLPVRLTSFRAAATPQCEVNLNWQTTGETNASYYSVERSTDNIFFTEIGRVKAAGNSTLVIAYSLSDNSAPAGKLFYRLRVVDTDDKYGYGPTAELVLDCRGRNHVLVYPTLTNGLLHVKLPPGFETASIKILNSVGDVVARDESKSLERMIVIGKEAAGTYMVQVINNGRMTDNVKVMLQR